MWLGPNSARRFIINRTKALGLFDALLDDGNVLKLDVSVARVLIAGEAASIYFQGRTFAYQLMNDLDFALFSYLCDEIMLSVSRADPADLGMMDIPAVEVGRPSRMPEDRLMRHLWQSEDHLRWHDVLQNDNLTLGQLQWRRVHSQSGIYAAAYEMGMIDLGAPVPDPSEFRARTIAVRRFGVWSHMPGSKLLALADRDGRTLMLANTRSGKILSFWTGKTRNDMFLEALDKLSSHPAIAYP